jgi:hypothetical protein
MTAWDTGTSLSIEGGEAMLIQGPEADPENRAPVRERAHRDGEDGRSLRIRERA